MICSFINYIYERRYGCASNRYTILYSLLSLFYFERNISKRFPPKENLKVKNIYKYIFLTFIKIKF